MREKEGEKSIDRRLGVDGAGESAKETEGVKGEEWLKGWLGGGGGGRRRGGEEEVWEEKIPPDAESKGVM